MAADPVAAAADPLGIHSSGTEGAAPSPAEAVLNQEVVENQVASVASLAGRPSAENPAAAAAGSIRAVAARP